MDARRTFEGLRHALSGLLVLLVLTPEVALSEEQMEGLSLSGSWVSAVDPKRSCTGIPASRDEVGAADFDLEVNQRSVHLTGLEYSADYKIQRVREGKAGGIVLELVGIGEDLGETTRIRAIWILQKNFAGETILTKVEWEEAVQAEVDELPTQVPDPVPTSYTYVRCR